MTTTPDPEVPSTFADEIKEIAGDMVPDLSQTFEDIDSEVVIWVKQTIVGLAKLSGDDEDKFLTHFASAMLWWFMMGREHAQRGYASPIPKSNVSDLDDDFPELFLPDWNPDDPT